jgi:hypothetical protein
MPEPTKTGAGSRWLDLALATVNGLAAVRSSTQSAPHDHAPSSSEESPPVNAPEHQAIDVAGGSTGEGLEGLFQ